MTLISFLSLQLTTCSFITCTNTGCQTDLYSFGGNFYIVISIQKCECFTNILKTFFFFSPRNSLAIHQLGLGTFSSMAWAQSLVRELRSHKLCGQKRKENLKCRSFFSIFVFICLVFVYTFQIYSTRKMGIVLIYN